MMASGTKVAMPSKVSREFIEELRRRYGPLKRIGASQTLFSLHDDRARVYVRYSAVHSNSRPWYGLPRQELGQLEGRTAVLCLLWPGQKEPLFVRYADFEEVFRSVEPARDGAYKPQVVLAEGASELYIPKAGRFNIERCFGWDVLDSLLGGAAAEPMPQLAHAQVQTLLGSIGVAHGHDIWVPRQDRAKLDWGLAQRFRLAEAFPARFDPVRSIMEEIDVIWMQRGSGEPQGLFEVEHTTSMYSGLLRFNDVHLHDRRLGAVCKVVADDPRRDAFARQLARPTFRASGLSEVCGFLEYRDVYAWHKRATARVGGEKG
jgi:hypothetical protein